MNRARFVLRATALFLSLQVFVSFAQPPVAVPEVSAQPQPVAEETPEPVLSTVRVKTTPLSPEASAALAAAIQRARTERLHESRRWRRLLFITPGWFSSRTSLVDSDTFFYAKNGQTSPDAELFASLEAMFHGAGDYETADVHAQCRFPGRFAFFKETFGLLDALFPKPKCAKFDNWFKNTRGDGVSLVFTNYFLNNPSSMFGHTFLRVHKQPSAASTTPARRSPLLDWSVSFAAFPTTSNPLLYAVMGLAGGFPGRFALMPHYVKAQEYNNHESRDLWEYDLAIDAPGVTRMLHSLWEIGSEHIDYYYFDDNCAYILLALIEVARDDVDLTSSFYFWVTPSDTVRVAARVPGLVRGVSYRPSNLSRFLERWDTLTAEEQDVAKRFAGAPAAFEFDARWVARAEDSKARILDALLEYIDFEEKLALGKSAGSVWLTARERILKERARTRVVALPLVRKPEHERPDLGHSTNRVGLTGGILAEPQKSGLGPSRRAFGQFEWRPSLHDMLAPGYGYPPGMELDFWDMILRYKEDSRRLTLHRLNFLDIVSPQPLGGLLTPRSWRFRLGTQQRERCYGRDESCFLTGISGGLGYTVADAARRALFYVLPGVDVGYSQERGISLYGGPSATAGLVLSPAAPVRVGLRGQWVRRFGLKKAALTDWESRFETSVSLATNVEARATLAYGRLAAEREAAQASLSLYYYYE